ncbi:MAG: pentapeptide repeat-containing protein [Candidatus Altimarinota bacterium]
MSEIFDLKGKSAAEIKRFLKKTDLTMEQKYWLCLANGQFSKECLEGVDKFITHISFTSCSFEGIDFGERTFFNCQFLGCSFKGAKFFNCDLEGVVFRNCQVTGMDFRIKEGSFGSFIDTNMEGFVTNQEFSQKNEGFDFSLKRK